MLMDEPFSGLDPINTEILRDTLVQRQQAGRTIIFSSHRLEQVEELCDYVAIIHKGRLLTTGLISDLKQRSGRRMVEMDFAPVNGQPANLDGLVTALKPLDLPVRERRAGSLRLEMVPGVKSDNVLALAMSAGPGQLRRFELEEPSLQEIFIEAVQKADPAAVQELVAEGSLPGSTVLTEG
jgi:ABC-2 type transport system ATP-binding protein